MSNAIIEIDSIGKYYRLGERGASYATLRDSLSSLFLFNKKKKQAFAKKDDGYIWALKDVSLEVQRGEVLGIVGKNGAGKTTLLKILSRITEPTEGKAIIKGRIASLLEVGTGFHPELTGRENVYLNGTILGMRKKEIDRKFDEIIAFAELDKFVDTAVKFYSSGMYVRLAFAVAAHLEPEILIIDEVLAVGDMEFQKKCIGKMESVAGEGRTVILVSHNMSTVKGICSKAVLLDKGEKKMVGGVDEVVNEYIGGCQIDAAEKIIDEREHSSKGGEKIRVKRIKILNGVNNGFRVHWQQSIAIALEIEVSERVDDVSFGGCLRMLDGTFVVVVYNDDFGAPTWSLDPGRHVVEFEMENNLKPGVYILSVGAHQANAKFKNFFHLDAANIEILGFNAQGDIAPATNPAILTGVKSKFTFDSSGSIINT